MDPELLIRLGLATQAELRAMDPDRVRAIKSVKTLNLRAGGVAVPMLERAVIDKANRRITYAGSVEIVDRMGDLILQNGWDTRDWKDHGSLFLWNHNHEAPIGQGFKVWRGAAKARGHGEKPALMFDIGYLQEDLSPAAEVVWRLASGDGTPTGKPMLKAVSVGLLPKDMREPTEEERELLKMDRYGIIYAKQDLLELSQAPVPANQAATQHAATPKSLKEADRRLAAELDATLDAMVDAGNLGKNLVKFFRESYPLTPGLAAERAAERVRSFHDLSSWQWGVDGETGAADETAVEEAPVEAEPVEAEAAAEEVTVTDEEAALLDEIEEAAPVEEEPEVAEVEAAPAEVEAVEESAPEGEERATETTDSSDMVTVRLSVGQVGTLRSMYRQVDALLNGLGELLDTVDDAERACAAGREERTLGASDDGDDRLVRALERVLERLPVRAQEVPQPEAEPTPEPGISAEAFQRAVEAITTNES